MKSKGYTNKASNKFEVEIRVIVKDIYRKRFIRGKFVLKKISVTKLVIDNLIK